MSPIKTNRRNISTEVGRKKKEKKRGEKRNEKEKQTLKPLRLDSASHAYQRF
jgi:hypothetical protein